MYLVAIDGILMLRYAFELEDYLIVKTIYVGLSCEGGFSHFREQFSGFA